MRLSSLNLFTFFQRLDSQHRFTYFISVIFSARIETTVSHFLEFLQDIHSGLSFHSYEVQNSLKTYPTHFFSNREPKIRFTSPKKQQTFSLQLEKSTGSGRERILSKLRARVRCRYVMNLSTNQKHFEFLGVLCIIIHSYLTLLK